MKNGNKIVRGIPVLLLMSVFLSCLASAVPVTINQKIDSLRALTITANDTTKAGLYSKIARAYRDELRDYDSSMYYANKVYSLTLKRSFPSACKWPEAWVYGEKGIAFYQLGQIDSAIYFELKCIDYCKKHKLINKEVDSGSRIIYCYYTVGNFRKAYDYIVDYDKKINLLTDTLIIANYHNTIGTLLRGMEDSTAISRLEMAYDLFKKIKSPLAPRTLINIGGSYQTNRGDFAQAHRYYQQFLSEISKDDPSRMVLYYISMGILHADRAKGNPDSSFYYLRKGYDLASSMRMGGEARLTAYHLGNMYLFAKNYQESLNFLNISLKMAESSNDIIRISRILLSLDDVYMALGEKDKAYDVLKRYRDLNDSVNIKKQNNEIKNLQLKHKVEQMENEQIIQEKDLRIKKQRYLVGLITIISLIILLVALLIYQVDINRKKKQLFNRILELTDTARKSIEPEIIEPPAETVAEPSDLVGQESESGQSVQIRTETRAQIRFLLQNWIRDKKFLEHSTVSSVATMLNTNPKYLSKVIHNEYNSESFNHFINSLRIKYCLVLVESDQNFRTSKIDSMAEMLGFGSKTTFTKVFRDITGLTPSYYISQLMKKEPVFSGIAG